MLPTETVSEIAATQASSSIGSKFTTGIVRIGYGALSVVAAQVVVHVAGKVYDAATGKDKKDAAEARQAEETRMQAQRDADQRFRGIINEGADRTAQKLSELLKAGEKPGADSPSGNVD